MRRLLVLLALLLAACGGGSNSAPTPAVPTLVAAGDSITLRTGLCPNQTWQQCQAAVPTYVAHIAGVEVVYNAGVGGDTCPGLQARLPAVLQQNPSRYVSVLIGGNDVNLHAAAVSSTVDCIAGLWAMIAATGAQPLAVTYDLPSPDTAVWPAGDDALIAALNAAIRARAAAAGVPLVDFEPAWAASQAVTFTVDGVHSNDAGATRLGSLFAV